MTKKELMMFLEPLPDDVQIYTFGDDNENTSYAANFASKVFVPATDLRNGYSYQSYFATPEDYFSSEEYLENSELDPEVSKDRYTEVVLLSSREKI